MSSTMTRDRSATRGEVIAHQEQLRRLASRSGLTNVRVDIAGTVVVHSDAPGYGPTKRFATAASDLVGAWVNVITDDVAAATVSTSTL